MGAIAIENSQNSLIKDIFIDTVIAQENAAGFYIEGSDSVTLRNITIINSTSIRNYGAIQLTSST